MQRQQLPKRLLESLETQPINVISGFSLKGC
jgi:hypothetical protein